MEFELSFVDAWIEGLVGFVEELDGALRSSEDEDRASHIVLSAELMGVEMEVELRCPRRGPETHRTHWIRGHPGYGNKSKRS